MTTDRVRRRMQDLRGRNGASWFKIVNHDPGNAAEVLIYDEIGFWGVSASDFVNQLNAITANEITVRLNTPGGEVFDGIAIYNALMNHPATITTVCDSLAASAGSFIMQAGKKRVMMPNSTMMVHNASGFCMGDSRDMADMAEMLDKMSANIASIYVEHAGGDIKDWRAAMDAETWYSADEAVTAGLADSVGRVAEAAPEEPMPANNFTGGIMVPMFQYAGRDSAPAPTLPVQPEPEDNSYVEKIVSAMREAFSVR